MRIVTLSTEDAAVWVAPGFLVLRASAYMLTFTSIAARNASSVPGGPYPAP